MAIVSPYLSITTLNVNGLHSPFKRHKVAEWIKKIIIPNYTLPPRHLHHLQGHTQAQIEEMEIYIPCKWETKEKRKQG